MKIKIGEHTVTGRMPEANVLLRVGNGIYTLYRFPGGQYRLLVGDYSIIILVKVTYPPYSYVVFLLYFLGIIIDSGC